MASIGEKIRARRIELNMSLEDVGSRIGVQRMTVYRWENGVIKNMGRDKIVKLAEVLQIPYEELLIGNEDSDSFVAGPARPPMTPMQEALLDAAADLSETEIRAVLQMIDALKSTRRGGPGKG